MKLRGVQVPGLDLLVSCDLPLGAGLAAAPAATVATARLLQQVAGSPMKPQELALLAQAAEQGAFIGERSSIINHLAICCSEADMATLIDCQSLEVSQLPVPFGEAVVVVVNTGLGSARAQVTNMERQRECDAGLEALRAADNEPYATLRQVPVDAIERHGGALPEAVRKRMRHAVAENLRVTAFADALRAGDLAAGGALMHESHQSLRENYEVSCPELDFIVDAAAESEDVYGCRSAGIPFGGCAVALAKPAAAASFAGILIRSFNERFGHKPEIYASHPTRGAVARLSGSPSESGFHQRVDMPTA
jgi:galactokinase